MVNKFISIDWGTSSFRAYLINDMGLVEDSLSSNDGILKFQKDEFHPFLLKSLDLWLKKYRGINIFLSGMIGSKNGLIETSYVPCKVGLDDIVKKLVEVDVNTYIVPGVIAKTDNCIELMRGEEVQIFGALEYMNLNSAFMILPGTHSKWAMVKSKKIVDFKTSMSGEVFEAISKHTILSLSISLREFDIKTYKKGVDFSKNDGGLLNHIFQVRTRSMYMKEDNTHSFLSGLVIGNEIKEMKKVFDTQEVVLVGSPELNLIYKIALEEYQIRSIPLDASKATQKAIYHIYKSRIKDA